MIYLNPTMNSAKVRTLFLVALCYSQGLAASMSIELTDEQIRSVLQGISVPPQPQIMVDLQMEQVMPDPTCARLRG